jgi:hypothetical protein
LKATSSKFDTLYQKGAIELPDTTDENGVPHLADYLICLARLSKAPTHMSSKIPFSEALAVCAAARSLRMGKVHGQRV